MNDNGNFWEFLEIPFDTTSKLPDITSKLPEILHQNYREFPEIPRI